MSSTFKSRLSNFILLNNEFRTDQFVFGFEVFGSSTSNVDNTTMEGLITIQVYTMLVLKKFKDWFLIR